jgi:sarcosine oxidase delta subunit
MISRCSAGGSKWNPPNNTVCALSDNILNIVLLRDVERDLSRASAPRWWHVGGCCVWYALVRDGLSELSWCSVIAGSRLLDCGQLKS